MKDYISFRDFIFHLSSVNDEPLYEVVTYLLHHDLNSIGFYNIDTDYKIIRFEPFDFNTVTEFLEEVQKSLVLTADKWIFSSSESLDELMESDRRLLTTTVMKAMHSFFKRSELLSFEPLNGLLHFEDVDVKHTARNEIIENPIDRDLDQNDQNYISALKYVNDLGKGIGSGKPLKLALEYLVKNISFSEVELYLYDAGKEKYFLVSHTDSLNYTTSIELLEGIYHTLDGSQRGINFSDTALKPFKYFYFEFSDLPDLSSIYPDTIGQKGLNQRENQLPAPNPKPLNGTNPITNLGENQRLLITYAFFSAEDMTCLIIDENPAYIKSNANYLRHHRMICKAIDAGALVLNDADEIPAKQVKTWLANHNFIYKGFNDNLSNDRDKMGIAAVGHVIKTYDQLVEELATANNRIKKLEQVKTEANAPKQQEKELDVDEEPNLKDSAYFLIAVLKDLLLDIEITGYYFQSDKDKGKKEPTQTVLAQHIEGMGIKDLKTRNINGLFAKANAMLSDAKKS